MIIVCLYLLKLFFSLNIDISMVFLLYYKQKFISAGQEKDDILFLMKIWVKLHHYPYLCKEVKSRIFVTRSLITCCYIKTVKDIKLLNLQLICKQ